MCSQVILSTFAVKSIRGSQWKGLETLKENLAKPRKVLSGFGCTDPGQKLVFLRGAGLCWTLQGALNTGLPWGL